MSRVRRTKLNNELYQRAQCSWKGESIPPHAQAEGSQDIWTALQGQWLRKCVQGGRAGRSPSKSHKGHNARGSLRREPLQSQEMVKLALPLVHLHHDTGQNQVTCFSSSYLCLQQTQSLGTPPRARCTHPHPPTRTLWLAGLGGCYGCSWGSPPTDKDVEVPGFASPNLQP